MARSLFLSSIPSCSVSAAMPIGNDSFAAFLRENDVTRPLASPVPYSHSQAHSSCSK